MDSDYNLLDAGTILNTGLQFLPLAGLRRSVFLGEVFLRIMAEAPSSLGWYVRPSIGDLGLIGTYPVACFLALR